MPSSGYRSFVEKQQARGRTVISNTQAAYQAIDDPSGARSVPLRNKRNGKVIWIKEEEVFYYLSPFAKPLKPHDRRHDGECMFERITPAEAAKPQTKTHAARPAAGGLRPEEPVRKTRKRRRGRRGRANARNTQSGTAPLVDVRSTSRA